MVLFAEIIGRLQADKEILTSVVALVYSRCPKRHLKTRSLFSPPKEF